MCRSPHLQERRWRQRHACRWPWRSSICNTVKQHRGSLQQVAKCKIMALFQSLCCLVVACCGVQAESSAAGREMQRRYYSPLAYAVTKLVSTERLTCCSSLVDARRAVLTVGTVVSKCRLGCSCSELADITCVWCRVTTLQYPRSSAVLDSVASLMSQLRCASCSCIVPAAGA